MSSTEYSVGMSGDQKTSSRVLKPPGGGHSDIFGSPEVKANPPRPKYNQQNSSNMNCVMGTTDPNAKVEKLQNEHPIQANISSINTNTAGQQTSGSENQAEQQSGGRARVPPGGFSSGLW